jgi:Ca-activated chloride channel family protein
MAARDVGTSRLSAAKAVAKRIVEGSPSRFGLVVFEGSAETVSPLTEDHAAVLTQIDSLDVAELPAAGSDIGAAITETIELAKSVGDRATDVVIISDGEHRGKDWQSALGVARTRGLRISAVVIGTEKGATIPDANGEPLKDDGGAEIVTRASREPLETIARDCGGKFWMNPFEEVTVGAVGNDALRRKPGDRFERIPVERYQWPLGAAFLFFVGAMIVNRGAE